MKKIEIKRLLKNFPKVFYKTRMWGKTTKLIQLSNKTGYPIVTACSASAKRIMDSAQKLELTIPRAMPVKDFISGDKKWEKVIIDDADFVLAELLNTKIYALSITNMKKHLKKSMRENTLHKLRRN